MLSGASLYVFYCKWSAFFNTVDTFMFCPMIHIEPFNIFHKRDSSDVRNEDQYSDQSLDNCNHAGIADVFTKQDVYKRQGNMEMVLDRRLSERRVFPAIDIPKSGTRREDLLLTPDELEAINIIRRALNGLKPEEAVDKILDLFSKTKDNMEFVNTVKKMKFI